jgi:pyruvate/2-oxoglutarate dehydrogenase complex dihydrolipoamide dehydrogenase (E3) component
MPPSEKFEVLVLGSGTGGKLIAWYMAQSGRQTAVVERRWVGGSCPNIACMPSKNEISSAKVAQLARDGESYGAVDRSIGWDGEIAANLSGAIELQILSRDLSVSERGIETVFATEQPAATVTICTGKGHK